MTNMEKYEKAFIDTFGMNRDRLADLKYQGIPQWDSVGHMSLIAAIEEDFDIMFDTDDIIGFNSFEKGKELIKKYNVEL